MTPELIELATTIGRALVQPAGFPPAQPREGQTREQWLAEVAGLRAQHDAMALQANRIAPPLPAPASEVTVTYAYEQVPVADGLWQGATVYRPETDDDSAMPGAKPAVLLLHGGGWWMAGGAIAFEVGDPFCRYLAAELDAVVVNFDYRLAPEHPFPAGLDDAEAAVTWMVDSAERLGIDPTRLGVFGISSGGNLAAAVCRRLRGTGRAPAVAMLLVPALDLNFDSPSALAYPEWKDAGELLRAYYVPDGASPRDPDVSPALADDPEGLPATAIVVGAYDPLHDDGTRYAELLAGAGIEVALLDHPMTHGVATPDVTATWLVEITDFGKRHLQG